MAVQPPIPSGQPPMPPGMPPVMNAGMPPAMKPGVPPQMAGGPGGPPALLPPGAKPPLPGQPAGEVMVEPPLPQLGFLQQPWVQNVLPFVTSLVAHAVIIILGVTLAMATGVIPPPQILVEEQTIIPEATLAEEGPPGGVPNVGTGGDAFKQAMQDTTPDAGSASGFANKASPNVDPASSGGGSGDAADSGLIGLGMGGMGKGGGVGSGSGSGTGGGSGDGGPLAMFGTPGGGAIGPKGPVFGNGGNARKIVFVCDATGTMINKLGTLKHELTKAIAGLRPSQSYNVVFFTDSGKFHIADKNGLIVANPDNKRSTFTFLEEITPTGTTDPIPGIEAGFKQQPQLLYFLSDGEFNNLKSYKEVIAAFERANPGNKVKVNTILFETFDKEAEEVMQEIAKKSGGSYRYVREQDLQ